MVPGLKARAPLKRHCGLEWQAARFRVATEELTSALAAALRDMAAAAMSAAEQRREAEVRLCASNAALQQASVALEGTVAGQRDWRARAEAAADQLAQASGASASLWSFPQLWDLGCSLSPLNLARPFIPLKLTC